MYNNCFQSFLITVMIDHDCFCDLMIDRGVKRESRGFRDRSRSVPGKNKHSELNVIGINNTDIEISSGNASLLLS